MKARFSLFPKTLASLTPAALAAFVRETGLDACNAVIRPGYWTEPDKLAAQLPAFTAAMRAGGVEVYFAETDWDPAQFLALPDPRGTLDLLRACGIRDVRLRQAFSGGKFGGVGDVPVELARLAADFERLVPLARASSIRFIYQLHHKTLVASPSALAPLIDRLPPECVGAMFDAGNQLVEGYEDWLRSARLLRRHLAAFGVKDVAWRQDPEKRQAENKGWESKWVPCTEGQANWGAIGRALAGVEFNGTLVLMPFYPAADKPDTLQPVLKAELDYLRARLQTSVAVSP